MRLLLDCIYTQRPSVCSTSYLMWEIIENLSKTIPDIQFVLLYPKQFQDDEKEQAFLNRRPDCVEPVPITAHHIDRLSEQFTCDRELRQLCRPGESQFWDVDAVVTSRMGQLATMRSMFGRQVANEKGCYQKIIGLDEMPMFSFRPSVPWTVRGVMDGLMLANYEQADAVLINNLWTLSRAKELARHRLSPTYARLWGRNVHETVPVRLAPIALRTPNTRSSALHVAFTGRVTKTRNFEGVAALFRKQFAYAIGNRNMKFSISTQSEGAALGSGDISFADFQRNGRDEFYAFLDTVDVAVNLSSVEDFSLSTYEPLCRGIPVIVADEPWSEFLGPDYPFRAKTEVEAYAYLRMFEQQFAKTYELFQNWAETYWAGFVATAPHTTAEVLDAIMSRHYLDMVAKVESKPSPAYHEVVSKLNETDLTEVNIVTWANENGYLGGARNLPAGSSARHPVLYLLKWHLIVGGWRPTKTVGVYTRSKDAS